MPTQPWVVRQQGEYLAEIAARLGCDPQVIWGDAANAKLRELRGDGSILAPGDVIEVPSPSKPRWLAVSVGATNRYVATIPRVNVSFKLSFDGEPCVGEAYTVLGTDPDQKGTTDAAGTVKFTASVRLGTAIVRLEGKGIRIPVRIGHLDPLDTPSGLAQRLRHLGYLSPGIDFSDHDDGALADLLDQVVAESVAEFQDDAGLERTGTVDGATVSALKERHGC